MINNGYLKDVTDLIYNILREGLPLKDEFVPPQNAPTEIAELYIALNEFFSKLEQSQIFATRLAQGDLTKSIARDNVFAMPLKELQANLNHLTWQANQVAAGNLNHQVSFLGEFSSSFNDMIESLRQKHIAEQRFATISEVIGEGLFLVDQSGEIIFTNPETTHILGYSQEELLGKRIHQTVYTQHADGTFIGAEDNPLRLALLASEKYDNPDAIFTCKNGKMVPVMLTCRPVNNANSSDGAVINFKDITKQKQYVEALKTVNDLLDKQASTDTLTGISNRLDFEKALAYELKRAERYESYLSLILFDIDHFKIVNDTHGHTAGDNVLKMLAGLIQQSTRSTDFFARWGGEEFVILSPGIDLTDATKMAELLRKRIESHDFIEPSQVTASFGVTIYKIGDDPTSIMNRADKALYSAKENGRNQVVGSSR